jgi:hypothetical protein
MPRFPDEAAKQLKMRMLARAPTYYFTAEDRAELVAKTGLSDDQITHWSENLRRMKDADAQIKFLHSEKAPESVCFYNPYCKSKA